MQSIRITSRTPLRKRNVTNNNKDWFDTEIADLIHVQGELYLKLKK